MIRLYICPWISATFQYAKVRDYGADYIAWAKYPIGANCFCYTSGTLTIHNSISADLTITAISPLLNNKSDLLSWINLPLPSLSTSISIALESMGLPVDQFVPNTTTPRQILIYLSRIHYMTQIAKNTDEGAFLKQNLDVTVSNLTTNQIIAAKNWMTSHNIDLSWVVSTTTIRQVLNYLIIHYPFHLDLAGMLA